VTARKRAIDLVLGIALAVVALPIVVVMAVCLTVVFRQSPFFMQERIGFEGRRLRFPKLRTMPRSSPAYALKTELSLEGLPRSAKLFRNLHIDELPQLLLVITGQLSLVGPRPKMPDDVEPCGEEYGRVRVTVPQGCTGLWQISVDKGGIPDRTPEYDLFYVAHQSNRFDLWILWQTFLHGLHLGKLVTLDDVPTWVYRTRTAQPTAQPAAISAETP
jgi:lipopolysaccharide/colanic/teichoic acid biosynthesis glycosyltransferase